MSEIYGFIVFDKKKIGKKKVPVEVTKIYLSPPSKRLKPIFQARVGKDLVLNALRRLGYEFEDKASYTVISGANAGYALRKLVVYTGVRQFLDEKLGAELLYMIRDMPEPELLFWFSRFLTAFDRGGFWDVYRVAKSFRILYRL